MENFKDSFQSTKTQCFIVSKAFKVSYYLDLSTNAFETTVKIVTMYQLKIAKRSCKAYCLHLGAFAAGAFLHVRLHSRMRSKQHSIPLARLCVCTHALPVASYPGGINVWYVIRVETPTKQTHGLHNSNVMYWLLLCLVEPGEQHSANRDHQPHSVAELYMTEWELEICLHVTTRLCVYAWRVC